MARRFSEEPNELRLYDNLSNSTIVFYYKMPTSADHAAYTNGMTKRIGNKIVNCTGEQRQTKGLDILTGFRKGDFEKPGGKIFSSDPTDKDFDPDWKKLVAKYAADLVEALAVAVFEMSAVRDDGPVLEEDKDSGESDPD